MGTLTLTELKAELDVFMGDRDDTDSRLVNALNIAQIRIARVRDWTELQATDSGTLSYTGVVATDKIMAVPTGLKDLYSFRIDDPDSRSNSRKLQYCPFRQWDRAIPAPEALSTDVPTLFTLWNENFELYKIPDQSGYPYEIRYSKWPTDFADASPSATSDLNKKDDMIITLAASWLYMSFREMEEANRLWSIYRNMANDAADEDVESVDLDIKPHFEKTISIQTDYWKDPFVTGVSS